MTCFSPALLWAQSTDYYVQLNDGSGFNTTPYQDSLELHAQALNMAIPVAMRPLFRVYDFGFYLHQEVTDGYPDVFEKKRAEIAGITPYYLIFGKQTDKKGIYTKFWVEVKMPDTGCFSDVSNFQRENISLFLNTYVSLKYEEKGKSASAFAEVELSCIDSLKSIFVEIADCCINKQSGVGCSICPTSEQIKQVLIENNFIGFPCPIQNIQDINIYSQVKNYSESSILGINMFDRLNTILTKLPSTSSKLPIGYVTDNSNLCYDHFYDSVSIKYNENLYDHDTWVHLWQNETGESYIFVKNEFYFLASDESFFDENIVIAKGQNLPVVVNKWITLDPGNSNIYLSSLPKALPLEAINTDTSFNEVYIYTVQSGESFSSIAALSHGSFSAEQLAMWNNLNLTSTIHPGDKLVLFPYNSDLSEFEDSYDYGLTFPIHSIDNINIYKFLAPEKKYKDFSTQPPNLGFSGRIVIRPLTHQFVAPPDPGGTSPKLINPQTPVHAPLEEYQPIGEGWSGVLSWGVRFGLVVGFVLLPSNASTPQTEGIPAQDFLKEEQKIAAQYKPVPVAELQKNETERLYVTYTKVQSGVPHTIRPDNITDISMYTTKIYIGRVSGFSNPKALVRMRNYSHHKNLELPTDSYSKGGCVDQAAKSTLVYINRRNDPSYKFIRGREQNVMNDVGQPWSMMPLGQAIGVNDRRRTRSGNAINGISPLNKDFFWECTTIARFHAGMVSFGWLPTCIE